MAKKNDDTGLPYFKFFIGKWIAGDITDCSLSAQGLFINLCAQYWIKNGALSLSKMKKKFPRKQKYFDELLHAHILKLNEDDLTISFLDEQLAERGVVSVKNKKAAEKRWKQNKPDADALQTHSEMDANAIPIEEKREEERRREESRARETDFSEEEFLITYVEPQKNPRGTIAEKKNKIFEEIFTDEEFTEGLARSYPGLNYQKAWDDCWRHHMEKPTPPQHGWQWRQKLRTWLDVESSKNAKTNTPNGHSKTERNANSLTESWSSRSGD